MRSLCSTVVHVLAGAGSFRVSRVGTGQRWTGGVAFAAVLATSSACSPIDQTFVEPNVMADRIFALLAEPRAAKALPALERSECARSQAADRAARVDSKAPELAHEPFDAVLDACGVAIAGENLARTEVSSLASAEGIVAEWLDSPGHRANILDPSFTSVGAACTEGPHVRCSVVFLGP